MDVDVTKEATARITPPSWRRSSIRYKWPTGCSPAISSPPTRPARRGYHSQKEIEVCAAFDISNTKCTLAFLVSSASTKASNTRMAMHDFLAARQAIVAEIQAEQVLVSSGEPIARFEQKIQSPSPASGARGQVRESGMQIVLP
jgi:hypothetical protein